MKEDIFCKKVSLKNKKEINKFIDVYNSNGKNIDTNFQSKFSNSETESFTRLMTELKNNKK